MLGEGTLLAKWSLVEKFYQDPELQGGSQGLNGPEKTKLENRVWAQRGLEAWRGSQQGHRSRAGWGQKREGEDQDQSLIRLRREG